MHSKRLNLVMVLALTSTFCERTNADEQPVRSLLDQAAIRMSLSLDEYREATLSLTTDPSWQDVRSTYCPPETKLRYSQAVSKLASDWNRVLIKARRDSTRHGYSKTCHSKLAPYDDTLADFARFSTEVLRVETKADLANAVVHVGTPLAMKIVQSMTGVKYCYIDFSNFDGNTDTTGPIIPAASGTD